LLRSTEPKIKKKSKKSRYGKARSSTLQLQLFYRQSLSDSQRLHFQAARRFYVFIDNAPRAPKNAGRRGAGRLPRTAREPRPFEALPGTNYGAAEASSRQQSCQPGVISFNRILRYSDSRTKRRQLLNHLTIHLIIHFIIHSYLPCCPLLSFQAVKPIVACRGEVTLQHLNLTFPVAEMPQDRDSPPKVRLKVFCCIS